MTDPYRPENCACFNIRRAARQVTQAYDRALRPAGLQATQFTILTMIDAVAGTDGVTVSVLADRLGMDRTTLTRNLGPIARSGWVENVPGPDRRERLVRLTDPGSAKLAQARPLWREAQGAALAQLGDEGIAALNDLTRRLTTT